VKHRLGPWAVIVAAAVCASACGGSTSAADGRKAADRTRRPAAEAYWKLYAALDGAVRQTDASGEFPACANGHGNSVSYKITYTFFATSDDEPQAQLTAAVKQRLSGIGWKLQPDQEHTYKATRDAITVRLREIVLNAPGPQADTLYVETGCVDVGKAKDVVSASLDRYPAKDAAAAPIPTAFPSPTHA
jgi:hypothetical protein